MTAKALVLDASTEMDWAALEQSLHAHFDVNAVTLDRKGERLTAHEIRWANALCAIIKTHPKGVSRICEPVKRYLIYEAEAKMRCAAEECAAGMYRIVIPVIRKNDIDGFISVCGRPYSSHDRIHTFYIHKIIDEDEEKINGLLSSLKPINYYTIKEIKQFITDYIL
jgi:ligand-binding sensor protein